MTKKDIRFRLQPYLEEAILQGIIDAFVVALLSVVLILVEMPWFVCLAADILYIVVALNFHYKLIFQAIIDIRQGDWTAELVSIGNIKEEYSFAGDRLGHSSVRLFYPKEADVRRYKIYVTDQAGKENRR